MPTTFDLRATVQKRGYFRATSNKMIYKATDSQVFKLKKMYVFPNVECIFSAKSFGLGNLSLLTISTSYLQSLTPLLLYIFIKRFYAYFN